MSILKQLVQGSKPKVSQPSKPFSLMSMFKKPNKIDTPKQQKQKEQHPYIQDIKKAEAQKAKDLEQKMNESKMTAQQRKLKEQLAKSKKSFVRVENGKQYKFTDDARKKERGFAQIIEVKWNNNSKQKEKNKQKSALQRKQKKDMKSKQSAKSSELLRSKKNGQFSRPAQPPFPIKKQKRELYEFDESSEIDDFLQDEDEYGNAQAFRQLKKMTGKFQTDKYRNRDYDPIRESTFDEVAFQQKISHALAVKEDNEQLELERRLKLQRKKRQQQKDKGR